MDWTADAIIRHREALKRMLATLVAMVGLGEGGLHCGPLTVPRRVHRAICNVLRPAESAARRLVITAARGIVVTLPPPRKPKPRKPIRISPHGNKGPVLMPSAPRIKPLRQLALPLIDPLRAPFRQRRRTVPAHALPRICVPGLVARRPLPPPPSPDDEIDATRLALRLEALDRALDDLPGQATRFARWKARSAAGRIRRWSALKPGRPFGWRSPRRSSERPVNPPPWARPGQVYRPAGNLLGSLVDEVQIILKSTQELAWTALHRPDTS